MAGPSRTADPLHVARRSDDRIVGHGVARRVVEIVGPLVDLPRPWLDGLRPPAILLDVGDALGRQRPHDLAPRDPAEVLRDEQADDAVGIRELVSLESVDGDDAVQAERPDTLTGPPNISRIPVEAVNEVAVARPQPGGQLAVAAAEVDDQSTLDPGGVEDLPRRLGGGRFCQQRRGHGEHACDVSAHRSLFRVSCVEQSVPYPQRIYANRRWRFKGRVMRRRPCPVREAPRG